MTMATTLQRGSNFPENADSEVDEQMADLLSFQEQNLKAVDGGVLEKGTKDTPCKFHDGFSETCWKGSMCPYSHKQYTGGKFAGKYPEIALAASASKTATSVHRLPNKVRLNRERQVKCRVTHVVSPSQFFVRAVKEDASCICTKVEDAFRKLAQKEDAAKTLPTDIDMDKYFFGLEAFSSPETEIPEANSAVARMETNLHTFLSPAFNYERFQFDIYQPNAELVAAYVNNKWQRALIMYQHNIDKVPSSHEQGPSILVQLLDTGEKAFLPAKDVCELPEKFANRPTSVFHCMLWGFSPVFFEWAKSATELFKQLVLNKDVIITVKKIAAYDNTFERKKPYFVQIRMEQEDGSWMDVGQRLYDAGYCLQWNPLPFRPFATKVVNTKCLDVVAPPKPAGLPPSAVKVENMRLKFVEKSGSAYQEGWDS